MSAIQKDSTGKPLIIVGKSDKYIICQGCQTNISIQYGSCPMCGNKTGLNATAL